MPAASAERRARASRSRRAESPRAREPGDLPTYLYDADTPRLLATPRHYAYVKIAEGCDYKCAFCIIPKLRGNYRSRSHRIDRRARPNGWPRGASGNCC